jgi:uncharacterized protein (TIGR03437 family)
MSTVVGRSGQLSTGAFFGDGGPATNADLQSPTGVIVDGAGNLYIADQGNYRIRKVDTAGIISTVAGNGGALPSPDGGQAASSAVSPAQIGGGGLAVDSLGNLYFSDVGISLRVRKVDTTGVLTTVAGNGLPIYSGDGGPAVNAGLSSPAGLAIDRAGNIYIADVTSLRVRKVNTAGIISTVAGNGAAGFSGDGGPATAASLQAPVAVAVDNAGNLYIVDQTPLRIRKVDTSGIIRTIAGNGTPGFSGDGGAATSAQLFSPTGVAVDAAGNVYVADRTNRRIRKIDTAGIITTVAGSGRSGVGGDGGPATSAELSFPFDVALDSAGSLYIADFGTHLIRKVSAAPPATPSISANGVVNGASFRPGIVANSWATILGSNLASTTATWENAIVNGNLPTTLAGVTVTVGGRSAYLYYVSPTQINLIAPDVGPGALQLMVTNSGATSVAFAVNASQFAPAFFPWPGNQVVATRQDFSFAARSGTFLGAATIPAKPGDVIILWGTGFGPTIPAAPTGVQLPADRTYSTSTLPAVTINNLACTVYGAALASGFAGLYQVAIQVPTSLGDGDWPVQASIGGQLSPTGMVLSVRR